MGYAISKLSAIDIERKKLFEDSIGANSLLKLFWDIFSNNPGKAKIVYNPLQKGSGRSMCKISLYILDISLNNFNGYIGFILTIFGISKHDF